MAINNNVKAAIENFTDAIKNRFNSVEDDITDLNDKINSLDDQQIDLSSDVINNLANFGIVDNQMVTQEDLNTKFAESIFNLSTVKAIEIASSKPTASAATMGKLYIVSENNSVNVYYTVQDGSSYSWSMMDTDILDSLTVDWTDINNKPSFGTGQNDIARGNHTHSTANITPDLAGITQTQRNQIYGNLDLLGHDSSLDVFLAKVLWEVLSKISNKANSSDIPSDLGDLTNNAGYIKREDISDDLNIDLSDYVTDTELNTALSSYVTSTTLNSYATDTELSTALNDYSTTAEIIEMINYATNQFEQV